MRKLSFVLLATILSVGATAQTLIPKVGGTFSTFAASDDITGGEDFEFKAGLTLGAGFEIGINDAFAIQPELLFQQKGGMQKDDDVKVTFNLNYIELPVMFKYKFSNFYVNAGPYAAFGLGGKAKVKPTGSGAEISVDIKFDDEPTDEDAYYLDNALDFGVQIGGGVVVMEKFVIDLRYGHGLGNLYDKEDDFDNKFQNRSIQLSVGYRIPLN